MTGDDLFDAEPVYERLAAAGVDSHAVQHERIAGGRTPRPRWRARRSTAAGRSRNWR
ncbi:hypothetical protein ACFQRB_09115 [Halobaculum litoreum]|uniref:Uncharacterized protein n=1 Tax=Halobaculum litoreum TaxID=3031998 RepID=A0ABD5XPQ6_9EURY